MKILLHLQVHVETLYKHVLCAETEETNLAALEFMWNSDSRKHTCEVFYTIWKPGSIIGNSLKIVV